MIDWFIWFSSDQKLEIFFLFPFRGGGAGKQPSLLITIYNHFNLEDKFYRCKNDFGLTLFNLGEKFRKCNRDRTVGNFKDLFGYGKLWIFSIPFFLLSSKLLRCKLKTSGQGLNPGTETLITILLSYDGSLWNYIIFLVSEDFRTWTPI